MTNKTTEAAVDWGAGVFRTPDLTPERLEASAVLADKSADEWHETAARLRAKAADLRANGDAA